MNSLSYFERVFGWYFRNVVFGGLKVLRERRFLPFSISAFILGFLTTVFIGFKDHVKFFDEYYDSFLLLEAIFLVSLLISSSFVLKGKTYPVFGLTFGLTLFFIISLHENFFFSEDHFYDFTITTFYAWIVILSIGIFSLVHNFFTSWVGKVVWMGNPEKRVLFSPLLKFVIAISSLVPLYLFFSEEQLMAITALIAWILFFVSFFIYPRRWDNGNVFAAIIGFSFLFILYHIIFMLRISENIDPLLTIDYFLILTGCFYSIQALSRKIRKSNVQILKKIGEERIILPLISAALGFHVFALRIALALDSKDPAVRFHKFSAIALTVILLTALFLFTFSQNFRDWTTYIPSNKKTFKKFLSLLTAEETKILFSSLIKSTGEKIVSKTFEVKEKAKESIENIKKKAIEKLKQL